MEVIRQSTSQKLEFGLTGRHGLNDIKVMSPTMQQGVRIAQSILIWEQTVVMKLHIQAIKIVARPNIGLLTAYRIG